MRKLTCGFVDLLWQTAGFLMVNFRYYKCIITLNFVVGLSNSIVNVAFSAGMTGSMSLNTHFAVSLNLLPDCPLALILTTSIGTVLVETVEYKMISTRQENKKTLKKKETRKTKGHKAKIIFTTYMSLKFCITANSLYNGTHYNSKILYNVISISTDCIYCSYITANSV